MAERVTDSCTPLLGIGAMASERYAPAGLLIERHGRAIMIGGGPGAEPDRPVEDWLVTDERAELIAKIRRMAHEKFGVRPRVPALPRSTTCGSTPSRSCIHHGRPTAIAFS